MIASFGYLTLALAFLLAVYGLVMVIWGLVKDVTPCIESARLALLLSFPLVTAGVVVLIVLLLDNRFDVAYVYSVSSQDMPAYLKLTALWGGQSGSLLFWNWLLAGFSLIFALRKWGKDEDLRPWSLLVVFLVLGFFLSLNVLLESPFERFWRMPDGSSALAVFQPPGAWPLMPQDGLGLNPLLRHPGMIWHPPTLYLGFVGFIIPFALVVGTLVTGQKDRRWLEITRPWILIAWVFLSLGLVLGMRWAYDVLGWGGYWGWDPVEIAALMPWLSGTAFLHTAFLQRRKGSVKRWNVLLIILTFSLVIFGTFLTRSGVVSSVHAFASGEIGIPMFFFTAVISLGAMGLLLYRWSDLGGSAEIKFTFSREVLTLFSTLVLLSILMVCILGVLYPILSELFTGTQVTVGPAWYKRIIGPLLILLLLLMGICPLVAWSSKQLTRQKRRIWALVSLSLLIPLFAWILGDVRSLYALFALWLAGFVGVVILKEFTENVYRELKRNNKNLLRAIIQLFHGQRGRYGGLMVHLGVVLMSLGIIGIEGLQQEIQATLNRGEGADLKTYQFKYESLERFISEDRVQTTEAEVIVSREGRPVGQLFPQRQVYINMGLAVTLPAVKSNFARDIYVILEDWEPDRQDRATFRFFINPLVNWLWIGAGMLTLGTLVAAWPVTKHRVRKT